RRGPRAVVAGAVRRWWWAGPRDRDAFRGGGAGRGGSSHTGRGGGKAGDGTNRKPPPPATVQFSTNIQPLFTRSCATSSACHSGPVPAQNLNLTAGQAYGNIVGVPATEVRQQLVAPGNPGRSYLLTKVEGGPGLVQSQMPIGCPGVPQQGVCFTNDQITALQTWISQCAQNN